MVLSPEKPGRAMTLRTDWGGKDAGNGVIFRQEPHRVNDVLTLP